MGHDPYRDANFFKETVEDPAPFVPATKPQIKYIQILATDLALNGNSRDVLISDILKRSFRWVNGDLSKQEASNVIQKFKAAKEQRDANEARRQQVSNRIGRPVYRRNSYDD